jgi:NADPH-dependent 2,4-dienoyl-CoA reductase/sulfur reductase-like enzyme
VVIGGSAAGMSAASKAKRVDPSLDVIVFERSPHVSFSACGIPYLVAGVVDDPARLQVMTAEEFRERRGIEVHTRTEVEEIDLRRKRVHVRDCLSGASREEPFDRLVIAVGASPNRPPIPGFQASGVFTLQTLEDGIRVRDFVETRQARNAIIVGGGYIAMEMAEAFLRRGMEVTVVERTDRVLPGFEPEIADPMAETLEGKGIQLLLRETVERINTADDGRVASVELEAAKRQIPTDVVLLATGVEPDVCLATQARLRLGPTGAIHTDWKMRTSQPDVYAAGDCVESRHLVTGKPVHVPLGPTANKQGRVAGDALAGGRSTFRGIVGTAIFGAFELEVARTGLNVAEAHAAGFRPKKTVVKARTKASYVPGSGWMTLVVISDRVSRRLLGTQVMGPAGSGKRIDVFAAALHHRACVDDVSLYDLAYAPPFSPVWDPILIAANQAAKRGDGDSVQG